jgi:hypothetical protein
MPASVYESINQSMAIITLTEIVQVVSLLVLFHELDSDEAVEAYDAAGVFKLPLLYRPTIHYQYHRFARRQISPKLALGFFHRVGEGGFLEHSPTFFFPLPQFF